MTGARDAGTWGHLRAFILLQRNQIKLVLLLALGQGKKRKKLKHLISL